jgi:outer membrane protein TolC
MSILKTGSASTLEVIDGIKQKLPPTTQNDLVLQSDLSYEPDVFGRVRNSVAAARANAQASAEDLGVVDLALHSELAMDYFTLRSEDAQQALLDQTVEAYVRALDGPSMLWSVGPQALLTLFDGGRRHAANDEARAAYDEQVANYRMTVATAYGDVEDWLAALRPRPAECRGHPGAADERQCAVGQGAGWWVGGFRVAQPECWEMKGAPSRAG